MKKAFTIVILFTGFINSGLPSYAEEEENIKDLIIEVIDLTKAPKPIVPNEPFYPKVLDGPKVNTQIILEFVVTAEGKAEDIKIVSSTHQFFNDVAIDYLKSWTFEPGELNGEKVSTRVRMPLEFNFAEEESSNKSVELTSKPPV